jgi:hypothetical protein
MFRWDISPPSSRPKNQQSDKQKEVATCLLLAGFLLGLLFDSEDGDDIPSKR